MADVLPAIRFHYMRHTCASRMVARGTHPKIVQELLGHTQISLTLDTYSHMLPAMESAVADTMERMLAAEGYISARWQRARPQKR